MIMNIKINEDNTKSSKHEALANSTLSSAEPPKDYELMLQGLEAEARNHIRVEQQLKLHIESLQYKMEDMGNSLIKEKSRIKELDDVILLDFTAIKLAIAQQSVNSS